MRSGVRQKTKGRRGMPLLLAAVIAAACLTAAAAPAFAIIEDPAAPPNHQAVVARTGVDYTGDIVVVGGFVYVCGQVETGTVDADTSLVRMSTTGDTTSLWTSGIRGRDHAASMAVAPRGAAIYTAGSRETATNADFLLIKWSKTGKVIWSRRYDATPNAHDAGFDVVVDRKGNVTVSGLARAGTRDDWLVVSWTPDGKRRWVRRLTDSMGEDTLEDMLVDRAGNLYLTGYAERNDHSSMLTVKLSPAGRVLWKRWYLGAAGTAAAGHDLEPCPAGGVYVAGLAHNTTGGTAGVCLRYSASGRRQVFETYDGSADVISLNDLAVLTTGELVGVGWCTAHDGTGVNCITLRWSSAGDYLGGSTIETPWYDELVAIAADPFGGYCWAAMFGGAADATYLQVSRQSSDGARWSYVWGGPTPSDQHRPTAIVAKGNVVAVCGDCISAATGRDQYVQVWRY